MAIEKILLRYYLEIKADPGQHWFDDHAAGPVQWRINNPQRFCLANYSRIEDQRFEPSHVCLVNILSDHRHFSLFFFSERRAALRRDRVQFGDDPAGVWLDHLRA